MPSRDSAEATQSTDKYDRIAAQITEVGWSVEPCFLNEERLQTLARESLERWEEGEFRQAGVGRGNAWQLRPEVRSDHVLWLDEADLSPPQRSYLDELDLLRRAINQASGLGLFGFEGHLAVYPPGTYYRRHLDRFQAAQHRVVSAILYLTEEWTEADRGALRIYLDANSEEFRDVLPIGGTLVTFLSDTFYHEVLPARRERLSLTGWFRRRE